jgi:hypothetical protein
MGGYKNMHTKTLQTVTRTMGIKTKAYKLASAELKRRGEKVLKKTMWEQGER